MKISKCMTRDVQLTSPTESIREAAKTMAQIDAGVLPVGQDNRLIGMYSAIATGTASARSVAA